MTIVVTIGMTTITKSQNVPYYVPTSGLVGWWPFNGNANDESGNGNNGTVNGALLVQDRYFNNNSAYSFDGINDFIVISNILLNGGYQSYSISYWYNKTVPFSVPPPETIINDRISGTSGFKYVSNNNSVNTLQFASASQNISSQTSSISPISPLVHTNSSWFNIIFTLNASNNNAKIYVNGVLDDSTQFNPNNWPTNNASTYIGAAPLAIGDEQWYNGKLDDIGIWNRAITQQEITELYNAVNCANNTALNPQINSISLGSTATFNATTSDPNSSYVWQSNLGQGFQTLINVENYSGTNTSSLNIANVQLSEHNQPIRVITTSGECVDTSDIATISILDTCLTSINDTTFITVTDTLVINTLITSINPPNNSNKIKVYPNPANSHITIDYGDFAIMNGYQLRIENSLGQQVFQTEITQQIDYLTLDTWAGNGLYFVHIVDPQGNTIDIRKIILQ